MSWSHPSRLLPCSPSRLPGLHVCMSACRYGAGCGPGVWGQGGKACGLMSLTCVICPCPPALSSGSPVLALGSPPGHRPGAADRTGGCGPGWGQGPSRRAAPLWSGRLPPLLRGLHAAALCRLRSAPGLLGATPPLLPPSIYKTPVEPVPTGGAFSPTKDTSSPHRR